MTTISIIKEIILDKMEKNAKKYPVDKAKGISTKYDKLLGLLMMTMFILSSIMMKKQYLKQQDSLIAYVITFLQIYLEAMLR